MIYRNVIILLLFRDNFVVKYLIFNGYFAIKTEITYVRGISDRQEGGKRGVIKNNASRTFRTWGLTHRVEEVRLGAELMPWGGTE